jgi:hypothetical protein
VLQFPSCLKLTPETPISVSMQEAASNNVVLFIANETHQEMSSREFYAVCRFLSLILLDVPNLTTEPYSS